jgi:N-acetylglucosaminyl-diphospho-decaprenol L-rhamnosyltransferase
VKVQPDLSVIILTHNTRDMARACVRSVLADASTTSCAIETIAVDNGSTDDTVTALRAEFPDIRLVVNDTNLGFARGNNIGLAAAHGRYLMLLNSDTQVQPGALATLIAFMDTHPDVGACGPQLLNSEGSLQPSGRSLPSVWSVFLGMTRLYRLWKRDFYKQWGRDYSQVARVGEVSGAALLVRREAYVLVGGLDPNFFAYYEDVDWCKRVSDAGYAIYYVPTAQVLHYWHGTSRSTSESSYRAGHVSQRYYFAKHHGPLAHGAIKLFLAAKELALIAASVARRDPAARRLHRQALADVFARLDVLLR